MAHALFVSNQSNKARLKGWSTVINLMERSLNCSSRNSKEFESRGGSKNIGKKKKVSFFYRTTSNFLPLKILSTLLGLFEEE